MPFLLRNVQLSAPKEKLLSRTLAPAASQDARGLPASHRPKFQLTFPNRVASAVIKLSSPVFFESRTKEAQGSRASGPGAPTLTGGGSGLLAMRRRDEARRRRYFSGESRCSRKFLGLGGCKVSCAVFLSTALPIFSLLHFPSMSKCSELQTQGLIKIHAASLRVDLCWVPRHVGTDKVDEGFPATCSPCIPFSGGRGAGTPLLIAKANARWQAKLLNATIRASTKADSAWCCSSGISSSAAQSPGEFFREVFCRLSCGLVLRCVR